MKLRGCQSILKAEKSEETTCNLSATGDVRRIKEEVSIYAQNLKKKVAPRIVLPPEKWGDSSEILNPYFNLPMAIPDKGFGVLPTVTNALNKIKNHKKVLHSVKTYCDRLETYFNKKIAKDQFIAIYKSKELKCREKRGKNILNS
jgi:hypothetical protein